MKLRFVAFFVALLAFILSNQTMGLNDLDGNLENSAGDLTKYFSSHSAGELKPMPILTKYYIFFLWTDNTAECELCRSEAKKMLAALETSEFVNKDKISLVMFTDGERESALDFLQQAVAGLLTEPTDVLEKVHFFLFFTQDFSNIKKEIPAGETAFPAVLIFQEIEGELDPLLISAGENVPWSKIDSIISKQEEE